MDINRYEPPPEKNNHPAVWPLVILDIRDKVGVPTSLLEDMRNRDEFGKQKYGVSLQPFNGRDAIRDAYQEALDLIVYLKQAALEGNTQIAPALEGALQCAILLRRILDTRSSLPDSE